MPTYSITAPNGKTLEVTGDHVPSESELKDIFAAAGVATDAATAAPAPSKSFGQQVADRSGLSGLIELGTGAAKGAGRTAVGLGKAVHMVPGVSPAVDALYRLAGIGNVNSAPAMSGDTAGNLGLNPTGNIQKLGQLLEQIGEFAIPAGAAEKTATSIASKVAPRLPSMIPRMVASGATSAGVTAAQGGDPMTAGVVGAMLPPVGAAASAAGRVIGDQAVPLVRSAIKPAVTDMKRIAGASMTGIDEQAKRLARFIISNRLTTPDKAQAVIDGAERELDSAIQKAGDPYVDAPQRALRYLSALRRSASQQGLGAHDVSIIEGKAMELLDTSPFAGQAPGSLRSDMNASEALRTARKTSQWSTKKTYGEMQGAATESDKAVERASRDSVKAAIPEAQPILRTQSQAITAKQALDRQALREGNRDAVSLPAHVMAAGEVASGRLPLMAFAANWLRNNQMKAGIYADRLASAINRNDVQAVSTILGRFGVGATAQASGPAYGQ